MTSHRKNAPRPRARGWLAASCLAILVGWPATISAAPPAPEQAAGALDGAIPDGPPDPTPEGGLTLPIDVDLKADPLGGFVVAGPVEWRPGSLTLASGGKIRREVELGAEVKLTLGLRLPPLEADGQSSTIRFGFAIRDRGEFVAVIARRREGGRTTGEIRLVDQDTPIRMADVTRAMRTFSYPSDLPDGPWTFRLHHGLFTVYAGAKRLAIGYSDKEPGQFGGNPRAQLPINPEFYRYFGVDEPLDVTGWRLENQGPPLACGPISGKAAPSYRAELAASFAQVHRKNSRLVPSHTNDEDGDLLARVQRSLKNPDAASQNFLNFEPGSAPDFRELIVRDGLGEHHPYYALVLRGRGMQLQWDRRDAPAQELLERALKVADEALGPWHPDRIASASALGNFYSSLGKFDRAEDLLRKASDASAQAFDPKDARRVASLQDLAKVYQLTDRVAAAETLLRRAENPAATAEIPPRDRALALLRLGDQQDRVGEREKAAALYGQAEKILATLAEEARDGPQDGDRKARYHPFVDLATAQVRHAWVFKNQGRDEDARKLAREAFLHLVQFQPRASQPGRSGGWDREMTTVQPNANVVSHPSYAQVLIGLGDLFIALGDYHPAGASVAVSDRVSLGIANRHDSSVLYRTTARLYESHPGFSPGLWRGHVSERQRLDFVVKRYRAENEADEAERQKLIASAQLAKPADKLPKEEMDRIGKKLTRPVGLPKGMRRNDAEGADYALDWLRIARREFEASSGPGHPETVDVMLDEARRVWRARGAGAAEPILRDAEGRTADLTARILPGLPEIQTYSYVESSKAALDLLLSCYRAGPGGRDRDAYEAVWRTKAMATRQVMERRELIQAAATGSPGLKKVAADLQAARQDLASLGLYAPPAATAEARQDRLAGLTRRKEDLEREAARLSDPVRRTQGASRSAVVDMIKVLPKNSAVIDFVRRESWTPPENGANTWTRSKTYEAFVIRPEPGSPGWKAAWIGLGDSDEIDGLLREWVGEVRGGVVGPGSRGAEVRRRLWAPLEASLAGCKTAVLIPEGQLTVVPWAALPGKRADTFLIEDYALAEVPFGQMIASFSSEAPPTGKGAVLLGGVDYGEAARWAPLPGTAAEVKQLESLWPAGQAVRLGGPAATKAKLLAAIAGRRYIHLATHGEFLDGGEERERRQFLVVDNSSGGAVYDVSARNPLLLTTLVLAGANGPVQTDGQGLPVESESFLTAEEVMGLDLGQAELVVLSACETGVGKIRGSEGVFSLQRAFQIAGSRAVVASLWQIADRSTQVLMQRFYGNLLVKKMSKIDALREAQIWMLREGTKQPGLIRGLAELPDESPARKGGTLPPFYWAAFVLSGDWR